MSYRSIGWRAVEHSTEDRRVVWHSSKIVREQKDAEAILKQWQEAYPRGADSPIQYGIEQVFTLGVDVPRGGEL